MAIEMTRVKNENDRSIALPNLVAEYCFGNCDHREYWSIVNGLSENHATQAKQLEEAFRMAIKFGLTYEMSTEGGIESERIWEKVTKELMSL